MKTSDLVSLPSGCIWAGCTNSFVGDMPEGWLWQIAYYDRQASILRWTPKQWRERPYQDVCLCPEHVAKQQSFFKPGCGTPHDNKTVVLKGKRDAIDEILDSLRDGTVH
jgi:hypothetical protein